MPLKWLLYLLKVTHTWMYFIYSRRNSARLSILLPHIYNIYLCTMWTVLMLTTILFFSFLISSLIMTVTTIIEMFMAIHVILWIRITIRRYDITETLFVLVLTHLPYCRIYASVNRVSVSWDNVLSPFRRQAWTTAGILLIGRIRTNFYEIWIKMQNFSLTKMHFKMAAIFYRGRLVNCIHSYVFPYILISCNIIILHLISSLHYFHISNSAPFLPSTT